MLTKNIVKKIEKLGNKYIDYCDSDKRVQNLNQMKALIHQHASKHELGTIRYDIDHGVDGVINNVDDARENLPLIVHDVYLQYNATPEIKSMCRNTKKSAKLRWYFFLGNMIGLIQHQNKAYSSSGDDSHDFFYYQGRGFVQADTDQDCLNLIKQGKANQTPNPADLIIDNGMSTEDAPTKIMRNIRIGKKASRSPKWTKKMLKRTDAQVC